MIVRLMGEGQYEVEDSVLEQLNRLDDRATTAVEAGDEPTLDQALDEMFSVVRERGKPLGDEDLSASDLVIPPSRPDTRGDPPTALARRLHPGLANAGLGDRRARSDPRTTAVRLTLRTSLRRA